MMHFSCDVCGKELRAQHDPRYVVKMNVFPAADPCLLTEEDLDEDHLEAVGQLLRDIEEGDETLELPQQTKNFRYDLCPDCHHKFCRDPLGKEQLQKLFFSEN